MRWKGYRDRRVLIFWKGELGRNGWNQGHVAAENTREHWRMLRMKFYVTYKPSRGSCCQHCHVWCLEVQFPDKVIHSAFCKTYGFTMDSACCRIVAFQQWGYLGHFVKISSDSFPFSHDLWKSKLGKNGKESVCAHVLCKQVLVKCGVVLHHHSIHTTGARTF